MSNAPTIPELDRLSGSWVILTSKGKPVYELYDRANVEKVAKRNPSHIILTAHEYLTSLNMNGANLARALQDRRHHHAQHVARLIDESGAA